MRTFEEDGNVVVVLDAVEHHLSPEDADNLAGSILYDARQAWDRREQMAYEVHAEARRILAGE